MDIRVNLTTVNGQMGVGSIDLHDVPGGWKATHHMLLSALHLCLQEILREEAEPPPRVQLVQDMPQGIH